MSSSVALAPSPSKVDLGGGLMFVFLWSTGYIAAVYGLQGSGPYTFAVVRFLGTAALIGGWAWLAGVRRPTRDALLQVGLAGVLLQGGFFGFAYAGMAAGCPPAVAGLICGLMPLVTALLAALMLGERLRMGAALGLGLGLLGVVLVVGPELARGGPLLGYLLMLCALLTLSLGTVVQKRQAANVDARLALVVQVLAASVVMIPLAGWMEGLRFDATPATLAGMAWAILVNSCAGVLLYLWLLKRGAAGKVASLFFLVPPVTALLAAGVLGATFSAQDAAGFALAAGGVWLGQRG